MEIGIDDNGYENCVPSNTQFVDFSGNLEIKLENGLYRDLINELNSSSIRYFRPWLSAPKNFSNTLLDIPNFNALWN